MRSDNATRDITTSVGSTALFVAAARALEAQRDDPLEVDPYAEVFCRAVGGSWADVLDGNAPEHKLKSDFGEVFQSILGARTRFFDNHFRRASAEGVRQMVILAAGLDCRAYRLDWPAYTVVFELDQPQVLEFKRAVLADHGASPSAERREVAVDLREDWPKALRDNGFDPARASAWLAERRRSSRQVLQSHLQRDAWGRGGLVRRAWLGRRGELGADYVRQAGRPVPSPDTEGGQMLRSGNLVAAKKR